MNLGSKRFARSASHLQVVTQIFVNKLVLFDIDNRTITLAPYLSDSLRNLQWVEPCAKFLESNVKGDDRARSSNACGAVHDHRALSRPTVLIHPGTIF